MKWTGASSMILTIYMTKSCTSHGHVYEPSHQNRCTVSLHHDAPYTATIATKSHQNSWNNNYDIMIHLLSESKITTYMTKSCTSDWKSLFFDFTWTCFCTFSSQQLPRNDTIMLHHDAPYTATRAKKNMISCSPSIRRVSTTVSRQLHFF